MDLSVFQRILEAPRQARERLLPLKALLDAVRRAEVPTIAAINGHCIGAAFELALVCDLRVSTPNALLGLPCILDSAPLSQFVGANMAREMILLGELYPAEVMESHGVLRLVANADELHQSVTGLLDRLTAYPPAGLAAQKRLFEIWHNHGLEDSNDLSLDEVATAFQDHDTQARLREYIDQLQTR